MAKDSRDALIIELKDTIDKLNGTITSFSKLLEESHAREAALQEQVDYLTKKLFGRSSEKHISQIDGQMSLFNEAEVECDDANPENVEDVIDVKSHTRKKKPTNNEKYDGIPVRDVVVELPEANRICPQCGSELEYIGKKFIREELQYVPAKLERIRYYESTYRCRDCCDGLNGADHGILVRSTIPAPLLSNSPASASSVAWTMYQKYGNAMPLYRQEKDWKTLYGITLTRATLAGWIIKCSERYLKPLYEFFRRELLKRKFLMADETRVQVLKEPGRDPSTDSFMWLFRTGEDGRNPIIIYWYTETRAKFNAADFLKGFEGYLMTDGYQGYNNLPGVKRCCCWAHVRRNFIDAIPKGHKDDLTHPAVQAVSYCDKLFHYERISAEKKHSAEQRKSFRLEKEKPVIEAFCNWLDKQSPAMNSRLYRAVNYATNHKELLMTYLENGSCSLSNNLSENAIRPFTVGRKNWLFSDTPNGAEASAICYTMVEMAKAYKLNPFNYLNYVLSNHDLIGTDRMEELLPWNPEIKQGLGKGSKM